MPPALVTLAAVAPPPPRPLGAVVDAPAPCAGQLLLDVLAVVVERWCLVCDLLPGDRRRRCPMAARKGEDRG